jgi:hypothetical protein
VTVTEALTTHQYAEPTAAHAEPDTPETAVTGHTPAAVEGLALPPSGSTATEPPPAGDDGPSHVIGALRRQHAATIRRDGGGDGASSTKVIEHEDAQQRFYIPANDEDEQVEHEADEQRAPERQVETLSAAAQQHHYVPTDDGVAEVDADGDEHQPPQRQAETLSAASQPAASSGSIDPQQPAGPKPGRDKARDRKVRESARGAAQEFGNRTEKTGMSVANMAQLGLAPTKTAPQSEGPDESATPGPRERRRMKRDMALSDMDAIGGELASLYSQLEGYSKDALALNDFKIVLKAVAQIGMAAADAATLGASAVLTGPFGMLLEMIEIDDHEESDLVDSEEPNVAPPRNAAGPAKPENDASTEFPISADFAVDQASNLTDSGLSAASAAGAAHLPPPQFPGVATSVTALKAMWALYKVGKPFVLDKGNLQFVTATLSDLRGLRGTLAAKETQLVALKDKKVGGVIAGIRGAITRIDKLAIDLDGLVTKSQAHHQKTAADAAKKDPAKKPSAPSAPADKAKVSGGRAAKTAAKVAQNPTS